jgi:glutathione S-transferase
MNGGGASSESIFHLTTPVEWSRAVAGGVYGLSTRDRSLDQVGFVHCSYRDQVLGVAELLYADAAELVVLEVDPRRLASPVRAENLEGGHELFPHLYGPLEVSAVVRALPMRRDAGGRFRLPAGL